MDTVSCEIRDRDALSQQARVEGRLLISPVARGEETEGCIQ